jgi:hypothetical protein
MKPKKSSPKKKIAATTRSRASASTSPAKEPTAKVKIAKTKKAAAKTLESETAPVKKTVRKAALKIPAILLEGDKPTPSSVSGPGQRYALGPTAPLEKLEAEGELPESYGTQKLLLAARDPHWLYAHWDLTRAQQRQYNLLSADKHLVLRIYLDALSTKPVDEIHVHPESRHWFVPVAKAGAKYLAELGYRLANGKWVTVSTSGATFTPPDTMSEDTSAEFTAIPFELPMEKLLSLVQEVVQENLPLAQALQELREQGHAGLPALPTNGKPKPWTPAQEQALARVISMDSVRRVWIGSMEITELIRRQLMEEISSVTAAQLQISAPTSPMGELTSPTGGAQPTSKGFWFNVNAELIVYGATEPNAVVTIGGRPIKLRPDGSFSYRFALPDGKYEMPVVAISADQTDGRAAELKFSRSTQYRGEVGAHPQDPKLAPLDIRNF